jgi:endonuclease/exonuclease/phosphatase family metal-dependent hydrolase
MKQFFAALALLFLSTSIFASTFSVMSYNVRCGMCEPVDSPNNWSKRKYLIAHLIKIHNPDIIGLQEAELFQVEDLAEMLDEYSWMGVGREDGRDKGETTAILFRHGRFALQGQQTLWLSETPLQASRGWDAAFRRTLSIAKLLDVPSKKTVYIFNTHLDNEGENARQEGAKLLLREIEKIDPAASVVVTGDFNLNAAAVGYGIITQTLADAEKISATPPTGGTKTFNAFGENKEPDNKIDFVFVRKPVKVLSHQIDTTTYNSLYPSDHYPIIVKVDTAPIAESTSAVTN